jgi:hypothetical protein
MQRQRWEYDYIHIRSGFNSSSRNTLAYLLPDGPKAKVVENTGGLFNKTDTWAQTQAWITKLGQESYEMTGVTSGVHTSEGWMYEYWFKRAA